MTNETKLLNERLLGKLSQYHPEDCLLIIKEKGTFNQENLENSVRTH